MANDLMRGRQTVLVLTNKSGGSLTEGAVVRVDTGTAASFTTTTTSGYAAGLIGVIIDASIANNASGKVCVAGYVSKVTLASSASLGDFVKTHTVAGQGTPGVLGTGSFAQVLGTGTSPAAWLVGGMPQQAAATPSFIGACVTRTTTQSVGSAAWTSINMDQEEYDTDNMHYTSSVNLTGTVAKTNGSATLTGTGTAFTSELSVGQVISVPGTNVDVRCVTAIASDTSLTVSVNFSATASGQTATRVSAALVARTAGKYAIGGTFGGQNGNATGDFRTVRINHNVDGQLVRGGWESTEANDVGRYVTLGNIVWDMAQWEFVTLDWYQDSGSARNSLANECRLWMYLVD